MAIGNNNIPQYFYFLSFGMQLVPFLVLFISYKIMKVKFYTLLVLLSISFDHVFSQEWYDKKIIYVENSTTETSIPEKIEIEFKYSDCIEINLGKRENVQLQKSYFRLQTNISRSGCIVSGKLDYLDCSQKIITTSFSISVDNKESLESINNNFNGYKAIKVYDVIVSNCRETEDSKDKSVSQEAEINVYNNNPSKKLGENEFYFFVTISIPTDNGIYDVYSEPIYHKGKVEDDLSNEVIKIVAQYNFETLLRAEAEAIVERKMKLKGMKVDRIAVEREFEEMKQKIIAKDSEKVTIILKTPQHNQLSKTINESLEQIDEIINLLEETINSIGKNNPDFSTKNESLLTKKYRSVKLYKFTLKSKIPIVGGIRG